MITNKVTKGKADLIIDDIGLEGDTDHFYVEDVTCSGSPVQPNKTCKFTLFFDPQEIGDWSVTAVILSNDPESPKTILIDGKAVR